MKRLSKVIPFLAVLGVLGTLTGCSVFKKEEENDGLSRWNETEGKPSRFARWQKWEREKADSMWRKFRDS